MKLNENKLYLKSFGVLALTNVLVYLLYHISYLLGFNWFEYVRSYLSEICEFILPCASAFVMLAAYAYQGLGGAVRIALISAGCRLFYTIPYYYMYYMNYENLYHNSADAIIVSLLISVAMIVITFLHLFLIFGIVLLLINPKKSKLTTKKEYLLNAFSEPCGLDFSIPSSATLLTVCIIQFVIKLTFTIFDTVSFLIEVGVGYQTGELLMIIFDYLIAIGSFVLAYFVTAKIKKAIFIEG